MSTERRRFDKEFKVETVRLIVEGGRKVSEVAHNLDIHENVLRKWKQQYLEDRFGAFPGKGNLKPDEAEYRKLLKKNADLKEERDILKKPWPSSQNTRDEISLYTRLPLHVQGEEDVPGVPHITERLLRMEEKTYEYQAEEK